VAAAALEPFDLARGPLLKDFLLSIGEAEHVLFLNFHHIVTDGWSIGVLTRELAALYAAYVSRRPSPLPGLAIQYVDFALWQRRWLAGATLENQLDFWRRSLRGVPPLELPADRPRPAGGFSGQRGGLLPFVLPAALLADLEAGATARGATLFMALLAAYEALLARYSGQTDFAVGSVVANRNHAEIESLIGFFVNTLALRGCLEGDPGFGDLLDACARRPSKPTPTRTSLSSCWSRISPRCATWRGRPSSTLSSPCRAG